MEDKVVSLLDKCGCAGCSIADPGWFLVKGITDLMREAENAGYEIGWIEGYERGSKEEYQSLADEGRVKE